MTPDENATNNGRKTFPGLKASGPSENASCRLCYCNIAPKLDNLCDHEKQENASHELLPTIKS